MKILFLGDIVGKPGRRAIAQFLPKFRTKEKPDLVIANCENAAGGAGLTLDTYKEIIESGVDYITSGDHIFDRKDFISWLNDPKIKVLRPLNYPERAPGRGFAIIEILGKKVGIINLIGRVFIKEGPRSPFEIIEKFPKEKADFWLVDFHGEATSEKEAMGWFLDGKIAAILGTHTHVQTADAKILPKGTAFITDVGMTGPTDGVIGVKKEKILEGFLQGIPTQFEPATGPPQIAGVIIEIDDKSNKAKKIQPFIELLS